MQRLKGCRVFKRLGGSEGEVRARKDHYDTILSFELPNLSPPHASLSRKNPLSLALAGRRQMQYHPRRWTPEGGIGRIIEAH